MVGATLEDGLSLAEMVGHNLVAIDVKCVLI